MKKFLIIALLAGCASSKAITPIPLDHPLTQDENIMQGSVSLLEGIIDMTPSIFELFCFKEKGNAYTNIGINYCQFPSLLLAAKFEEKKATHAAIIVQAKYCQNLAISAVESLGEPHELKGHKALWNYANREIGFSPTDDDDYCFLVVGLK